MLEANEQLPWTGERLVSQIEGNVVYEHLHRYALARDLAAGKVVLDIACGEGYGSALLAQVAAHVTGVDIAADVVHFAERTYRWPNLTFREGRCDAIPLADASVDLVVSFETLEHHTRTEEMMTEIRRVLRPEGVVIISTPDKLQYTDLRNYVNPFHVRELYLDEFRELMRRHFRHTAFASQRICRGSVIAPLEDSSSPFRSYLGNRQLIESSDGLRAALYLIGVGSDGDQLPRIGASILEGNGVLLDIEVDLARLAETERRLSEVTAQRDALLASLTWRLTRPCRSLVDFVRGRKQSNGSMDTSR